MDDPGPQVVQGMPPFWVAYVLLIALTIKLKFFPSGGCGTTFTDHLVSLVLPGWRPAGSGVGGADPINLGKLATSRAKLSK